MVIEGTVKGAEEEHVEKAWVVPSFTADSMANEVARQSREVIDRAYCCLLANLLVITLTLTISQ